MKDSRYSSKSFRPELEAEFIDINYQLKLLENTKDSAMVKWVIPIIRARLFKMYNLVVYGLDVEAFASHNAGDKTPLNSECC